MASTYMNKLLHVSSPSSRCTLPSPSRSNQNRFIQLSVGNTIATELMPKKYFFSLSPVVFLYCHLAYSLIATIFTSLLWFHRELQQLALVAALIYSPEQLIVLPSISILSQPNEYSVKIEIGIGVDRGFDFIYNSCSIVFKFSIAAPWNFNLLTMSLI